MRVGTRVEMPTLNVSGLVSKAHKKMVGSLGIQRHCVVTSRGGFLTRIQNPEPSSTTNAVSTGKRKCGCKRLFRLRSSQLRISNVPHLFAFALTSPPRARESYLARMYPSAASRSISKPAIGWEGVQRLGKPSFLAA
jgi:hypothetical protein